MHLILLACLLSVLEGSPATDTVVVCPESFRPSLKKWIEYRELQGHKIEVLIPAETAAETRDKIRSIGKQGGLKHILLVGDATPPTPLGNGPAAQNKNLVPTFFVDAKVNVQFGSEKTIATDNPYADLDDDGIPDVAIGRITADTKPELVRIVTKIIDYESHQDCSQWRKRINFVAGMGGFGKIEDSILESATKQFISKGIPDGYRTSMTYASWQSPYCPDPRLFHRETLQRMNDGCLLWVYIGHGHVQQLDQVHVAGVPFHIFDVRDVPQVSAQVGLPIAVFLACYTAAFDAQQDCLAEELLRKEQGPVAVLGGTRVTLPYAMSVMALEMLDEYFLGDAETLGEVLLNAKRATVTESQPADQTLRGMLDSLAQVLSPTKNMLAEERMENLLVFHLIGDPLLVVKRPLKIEMLAEERTRPGDVITVSGNAPLAGRLTVELACPRDRLPCKPVSRGRVEWTPEYMAELQDTYEQANHRTIKEQSFEVPQGPFKLSIPIPADARGKCDINAFLQSQKRFAVGNTKVMVR